MKTNKTTKSTRLTNDEVNLLIQEIKKTFDYLNEKSKRKSILI